MSTGGRIENPDLPRQLQQVEQFATLMKQQLELHQDKGDWRGAQLEYLHVLAVKEVGELIEAALVEHDDNVVWRKAANVANFAMMIADVRSQPA